MRTYHDPSACPKYAHCSAPLCPLADWRLASHLPGERVCFYLREWSKRGGTARVAHHLLPNAAEAVAEVYRAITRQPGAACRGLGIIRRILAHSARTGSKIAAGDQVRQSRAAAPAATVQL